MRNGIKFVIHYSLFAIFPAVLVAAGWFWAGATYHLVTVDDGKLYRDGIRSTREFRTTLRRVRPKTVVRLIDEKERDQKLFRWEEQTLRDRGIEVADIPVKLGGWPTTEDLRRFLQIAADPARYDGAWTFSQCGDSGEVYAFDASLIADEEDVTA